MYPDYIMHFNPNHDPNSGKFTSGPGASRLERKIVRQMNRAESGRKSVNIYIEGARHPKNTERGRKRDAGMASFLYGYDLQRYYKKLDRLISKADKKGVSVDGPAWREFNKNRIDIGKQFIETTPLERLKTLPQRSMGNAMMVMNAGHPQWKLKE